MRQYKSLKTSIYIVGVASLFIGVVNVIELNKNYVKTDKSEIYGNLDIQHHASDNTSVANPISINTRLSNDVDDTSKSYENARRSGDFNEHTNVHGSARIPKNVKERSSINNVPETKKPQDLNKQVYRNNNVRTPKSNLNVNTFNSQRKVKELLEVKDESYGLKTPLNSRKDTRRPPRSDPLKLPNGINKPVIKSVFHTVADFRLKAKQDTLFLNKILNQHYLHPKSRYILKRYFTGANYSFEAELKNTFEAKLRKDYDVNNDVMVFMHIQKTGGMHFNDKLSRLTLPFKCKCPKKSKDCICLNPSGNAWIYTSKFIGWPCGLHADWTQLHRCLPGQMDVIEGKNRKRRYFYFTQLRDPISRYMSEFYHQSVRGGHWQDALLGCGSGFSDWIDIRPCFHTESWKGVKLDDFMACPHNLATNRMTRMLADLNQTDCYRKYGDRATMAVRAVKWLESAKETLQQMEYFGLMEVEGSSDMLFSSVFKMHSTSKRANMPVQSASVRLTEEQFLRLLKYIELDIHIYLFAKDLLERRLRNV